MTWDDIFLEIASTIAKKSKDPSTKVGAVIVDDKSRVVALGYNGFPHGVDDYPELYKDRERKYQRVIHAEENALLFSDRQGHTLYVTHPICGPCMAKAIQKGIKRIVFFNQKLANNEKWSYSHNEALIMAQEAGIIIDVCQI